MLVSLKELSGSTIKVTDGDLGQSKDVSIILNFFVASQKNIAGAPFHGLKIKDKT
jgi:hypothetical protein